MTALPPAFAITPDQIDAQVAAFYAAVRRDPLLGPVFAHHVTDWPEHEAKIGRFWRNAILRERVYDGSPMMAHRQAGDVVPDHFPQWLALFDATLDTTVPPDTAAAWSAMAHRIGRALAMGVSDARRPSDAVPRF
ncbi:group III truncated hemoglobin [Gemmobacter serpentinus]|uniref:group III truncated hemoglobin n=1 Tax=Gemmobacter serpentinus TaxID=2652247 RepID=UPI00124F6FB1|nr:group III truncated hemoglobin [Gemmobacter serpentinus]